MRIPFFHKEEEKRIEGENLLALDVGTEFVKAVVFRVEDGLVNIYGYGIVRQQQDAMKGAMIVNIQNVVENCALAIDEALKSLEGESPTKVLLGIAGELVKGVTIQANYDREEPEGKIDKEEIKEIVDKVKENAFDDVKTEIAKEAGIAEDQLEEIDTVVTDTFIDGFRVVNPLGFQGKAIKFRVFTTFAPSIHANSLRSIAEALELEVLSIVVEPYAIARSYEGAKDDTFSAIFIDVGGGTTDVAVVWRGGVVGTQMFAFGGRVFTKRLEADLSVDYAQAEKMKLKYSAHEIDKKIAGDIERAIKKDVDVWVDGVELALSEFEDVEVFPSKILLCGGGSLLPEIKSKLISHPWLQALPFSRFPKVMHILPENIDKIADKTGLLKTPIDVAPAAIARMVLEMDVSLGAE